ncbi:cysteine hydrolase family protein [Actinocatenispora comari]|jgi:nicotinamidase/pyrazinamidase|nr:isochorismatase family cysteine hydrolase [Actinocatenispora comari]
MPGEHTAPTGTALIVVDMQNAFVARSAAPETRNGRPLVAEVNARINNAIERGWPIFYTRDIGPWQLPPGDPDGQTVLFPGLQMHGDVVPKGPGKTGGMSGFVLHRNGPGSGGLSDLAARLNATSVDAVVVVGIAADVCVAATAHDALRLGYRVTVDLGASAFVHAHPDGDQAAIADLVDAGILITGA